MGRAKNDIRQSTAPIESLRVSHADSPSIRHASGVRNPADLVLHQLAEELGRLAARALANPRRGYSYPELIVGSLAWLILVQLLLRLLHPH